MGVLDKHLLHNTYMVHHSFAPIALFLILFHSIPAESSRAMYSI